MEAATRAYQEVKDWSDRDRLILENLPYVRHVLGRLAIGSPTSTDMENLLSAGTVGLVEAAGSYDPDRGVAFRTFAHSRIRGAIIDELRRNCAVPQRVLKNISLIRAATAKMTRPATPEAMSESTGLNAEQVGECLAAIQLMDKESWEEWDAGRPVHGAEFESPETPIQRRELVNCIADCIERLPERERLVITLYHSEEMRLKEIGAVLHLSESRVSRVLARAVQRVKVLMQDHMN